MKKKSKNLILTALIIFIFFFVFRLSLATNTFSYPWSNPENGIPGLINQIYLLALGLAGGAAFVVLIWGAILYTVSGAVDKKSEAKEWIKGAIYGLILLFGAYLILYTINPNLVNLNFVMPSLTVPLTVTNPNPSVIGIISSDYTIVQKTYQAQSPTDQITASEGRTILQGVGIQECNNNVVSSCVKSECAAGATTGCVSINNMRKSTVEEITSLPSAVILQTRISGGTEGGHTEDKSAMSHSNGYKFDISSNQYIDAYVTGSFDTGKDPGGRTAYIHTTPTGKAYYVKEDNVGSLGQHWDVLVVPGSGS